MKNYSLPVIISYLSIYLCPLTVKQAAYSHNNATTEMKVYIFGIKIFQFVIVYRIR